MREYSKSVLKIILAAVLFGLIPIIVKFSTLDSYSLTIGRILFATLFLFIWVKFAGIKLDKFRKDRFQIILFGLFHGLIIVFSFISIKLINVSIAVLLLYSGVIYLVVLSYFLLKERIEKITLFSLLISSIGLFLIFYTDKLMLNWWGYLAGLLSGLFMAFVYLLAKSMRKRHNTFSVTYYQNLIALPLMLPLIFLSQFEYTPINIFTLISLGIFCTAVPFLLLYSGIKNVKAQKVGILLLMEVITPIFLALVLIKEIPEVNEIIGGILIFAGFVMVTLFHKDYGNKRILNVK